jgi:hypothetical protein
MCIQTVGNVVKWNFLVSGIFLLADLYQLYNLGNFFFQIKIFYSESVDQNEILLDLNGLCVIIYFQNYVQQPCGWHYKKITKSLIDHCSFILSKYEFEFKLPLHDNEKFNMYWGFFCAVFCSVNWYWLCKLYFFASLMMNNIKFFTTKLSQIELRWSLLCPLSNLWLTTQPSIQDRNLLKSKNRQIYCWNLLNFNFSLLNISSDFKILKSN